MFAQGSGRSCENGTPRCRTTIRSQISSTSASAWEVKSKVRPRCAQLRAASLLTHARAFGSRPLVRLVEDVESRSREEGKPRGRASGSCPSSRRAPACASAAGSRSRAASIAGHRRLVVPTSLQPQHERQEVAPGQVVRRHEPLWQERELRARARVGVAERRRARSRPASAAQKSSRHLMSVVLPAPFTPTRPRNSPRSTSRSTPRSTSDLPKRFVSPLMRMTGSDMLEACGVGRGMRLHVPRASYSTRAAPLAGRAESGYGDAFPLVFNLLLSTSPALAQPERRSEPGRDRERHVLVRRPPRPRRRVARDPARERGRHHGRQRQRQDDLLQADRRRAATGERAKSGSFGRADQPRADARALRNATQDGHAVPVRRALHRSLGVRQRRVPDARAHRSARTHDPRPRADEAAGGRVCAARPI